MIDRNEPLLPPGEFNRLYTTSDQAIQASVDSLPAKAPDREKSPREIAQEILQRRLGETARPTAEQKPDRATGSGRWKSITANAATSPA
jgi:hypothetical protein